MFIEKILDLGWGVSNIGGGGLGEWGKGLHILLCTLVCVTVYS